MLEEEEGIPSRLQPSAEVYIPKAEPNAERKKEDEEAGQGPDNHDGKAGHESQGLAVEKGEKKKDSHSEMSSCGSHSKGRETLTGMAHMVRVAEKNVQDVEQEMIENGWTLSSQTNWDRPNVNVCTARGAKTLHKHLRKKLEARQKELQKMKDDKKKVTKKAKKVDKKKVTKKAKKVATKKATKKAKKVAKKKVTKKAKKVAKKKAPKKAKKK